MIPGNVIFFVNWIMTVYLIRLIFFWSLMQGLLIKQFSSVGIVSHKVFRTLQFGSIIMQQSHNYLFKYEGKIGINFEKPNQFTFWIINVSLIIHWKNNNYQYKTNTNSSLIFLRCFTAFQISFFKIGGTFTKTGLDLILLRTICFQKLYLCWENIHFQIEICIVPKDS
jgi:hypothetical protein